jgi:Secretion system C-terminal sorting domain
MKFYLLAAAIFCLLLPLQNFSQTPGIIVRPAGSNGPAILDPNADGYTSKTTAGYGTDDIANSEIPYKVVPPLVPEPTGDLLRGPSGSFSDIVKTVDGSGFYLYNDGTNLLCRIRIGGIVSGSKGYSILLDTDSKFGNSGPYADPNYQPATTGSNGNPGFELEIDLQTNFQVAVYNVDGTSTPTLMTSYPINTNSQISVAASADGGDPDYFYDFYVPFSALGISASTPIRATATTVMAPLTAIGGPKSDIYGVSGNNYMNDWTTSILSQKPFTFDSLKLSGGGIGSTCTTAPVLNGPVTPSATTVSGTWTKSTYSSISTATITLFKGSTAIGTTTVSSGGTWSINVSGLANSDVLTAKAQGSGESMCLASNSITVNACNASNSPATPVLSCTSGSKGITGTNLSTGWTVHVDNITRNVNDNSVTNSTGLFGANSGSSPNITWLFSGGCSTGAPLTSGSYKVYYTDNTSGCSSQPAYFCAAGNGPNALAGSVAPPTITTPSNGIYTPATTSITGATTASATLYLYINGVNTQTTTAAANGSFTFSNLAFTTGQQFYITAELNTGTVGTSYCAGKSSTFTVTCFTSAPVINVGSTNQLTAGSPITGTSADGTGTVIKVYNSSNTLLATATVQSDGTWSTGNAGTTPTTYNAVAAASYYANAQNGGCGVSSNSSTYTAATATSSARCGTLPATVNESVTSVSGTLSGTALAGTVVTLYGDGVSLGTATTSTSSWGPIAVNTIANNTIYAGEVLTIGITEPSKTEVICGTSVTVSCTPPSSPVISPTSTNIFAGQTVTYTITSPQSGILYSLRDNSDAANIGSSKFGSGSSITIVTDTFNTPGTYTVNVKAISFSGANCQSSAPATIVVSGTLPVTLVDFEGKYSRGVATLHWATSSEQNLASFELEKSYTGNSFVKAAEIKAAGNSQVVQNYFHNDSLMTTGVVYYRLKMNDVDKVNFKYSRVIALHIDKGIVVNSISPNPFSNAIRININVIKESPLAITLSDMAGKKIRTINYEASPGSNTILLSGFNNILKGTYLLELNSGTENISRQLLIKQ